MTTTWNDVLSIEGFSSAKTRNLLNAAASLLPYPHVVRLLEVGSYIGSTASAICWGREVQYADLVDNHSEFGDTRTRLAQTVERFGINATLHDCDFFAPMDVAGACNGRTFNVYHYDGPHDYERHATELEIALPHLEREFVYVVDDYSWPQVRAGCEAGLERLADRVRVNVLHEVKSHRLNDGDGYWNGVSIRLCEKLG